MVIGAFPLAKLGVLLVKQISKPFANEVKNAAKNHPFFRQKILIPTARFYNYCEIYVKMWVLNMGKPVNIPVMKEHQAIELGSNILGEGIVFFLMAFFVIEESIKQISKNKKAEKEKKIERDKIKTLVAALHEESIVQANHIQMLTLALMKVAELPQMKDVNIKEIIDHIIMVEDETIEKFDEIEHKVFDENPKDGNEENVEGETPKNNNNNDTAIAISDGDTQEDNKSNGKSLKEPADNSKNTNKNGDSSIKEPKIETDDNKQQHDTSHEQKTNSTDTRSCNKVCSKDPKKDKQDNKQKPIVVKEDSKEPIIKDAGDVQDTNKNLEQPKQDNKENKNNNESITNNEGDAPSTSTLSDKSSAKDDNNDRKVKSEDIRQNNDDNKIPDQNPTTIDDTSHKELNDKSKNKIDKNNSNSEGSTVLKDIQKKITKRKAKPKDCSLSKIDETENFLIIDEYEKYKTNKHRCNVKINNDKTY